jgi:hypothetical protein
VKEITHAEQQDIVESTDGSKPYSADSCGVLTSPRQGPSLLNALMGVYTALAPEAMNTSPHDFPSPYLMRRLTPAVGSSLCSLEPPLTLSLGWQPACEPQPTLTVHALSYLIRLTVLTGGSSNATAVLHASTRCRLQNGEDGSVFNSKLGANRRLLLRTGRCWHEYLLTGC